MKRKSLSETENRVLKGFIEYLTNLYPEQVVSIELFGSKARGNAEPDSDIDLLIIVQDRNNIDRSKIYDYVLDAELNHGINISLKIYNKDDYNKLVKMNVPFATNVQKEGVTLWTM
ncbi:nucleotidyltransferase domain-containing protein [Desulfallas sp. Bu1-1]|jgi:predicted nucleotidyltransferase|uniref:nucleotidyltransferase domain-containing protein n=1 Tax=Desulfallas sp. Bu1-1 TaxID=2787620 RepID=UPI00189F3AC9|nr:nucleotidyltransferase domain-containing protein [Desulfallas sp. Bu1-1]MBF7082783.1 nucleotidyltransferase domain-containing protein [Desulfallas sp. Bu1-1]